MSFERAEEEIFSKKNLFSRDFLYLLVSMFSTTNAARIIDNWNRNFTMISTLIVILYFVNHYFITLLVFKFNWPVFFWFLSGYKTFIDIDIFFAINSLDILSKEAI